MPEDFTTRELGIMLSEMKDSFGSKLDAIHEQTMKTNGRVSKLEDKGEKMEAWRNKIVGALVITEILVLPIVLNVIFQFIKTNL